MKRGFPIFLSIFVVAASISARAETDTEVQARKAGGACCGSDCCTN